MTNILRVLPFVTATFLAVGCGSEKYSESIHNYASTAAAAPAKDANKDGTAKPVAAAIAPVSTTEVPSSPDAVVPVTPVQQPTASAAPAVKEVKENKPAAAVVKADAVDPCAPAGVVVKTPEGAAVEAKSTTPPAKKNSHHSHSSCPHNNDRRPSVTVKVNASADSDVYVAVTNTGSVPATGN